MSMLSKCCMRAEFIYRIRLVESEKKNETNYTAALDDARPFDTNSNARMRAAYRRATA